MKNKIFKGLIVAGLAITAALTYSITSVSAASIYDEYSLNTVLDVDTEYTLEEMLNYAIMDEYLAQAEYQAIIANYGEVMPFVRVVEAEQSHINLLSPLFLANGFEVPENNAAENVVLPDSITSALATGVEAEKANISMYETFLAQNNLPEDVRSAFESLAQASEQHLAAFSGDRYAYYGQDMMNQIQNQWRKMFNGEKSGSGNQYKGSRGQQSGSLNNYAGDCPNA